MRAVVITRHGPPEVLQIQERPDPRPAAGEVLIDVRASGINFADVMARLGLYPDAPKPPSVVGYEVAGTVAELGAGVEGIAIGDRVAAPVRFGGYAERVVTAAGGVFALPEAMSFEAGAAIPVNYATAWEAITRLGNVSPGERVLIHSAGGGVGIAATQLAKRAGAEVWGTASPGKHQAIAGFGVDHPIDYTAAGWERGVPRSRSRHGRDRRRELPAQLQAAAGRRAAGVLRRLRSGGWQRAQSRRGGQDGGADAVVQHHEADVGLQGGDRAQRPDCRGMNTAPSDGRGRSPSLIADGTIRPVVAQAFPFAQAADAHRFIAERRNIGKVVLVP